MIEAPTSTPNLRQLRTQKYLTQRKAAQLAGLSVSTLVELERGRTVPRVATLQALAQTYGVTIDEVAAAARRSGAGAQERGQEA